MGPKKSASDWSNDSGFPSVLQKLCKEEDVLIIPQFVTVLVGRQAERISPKKSKDSKLGSNSVFASDSKGEDLLKCGSLQPPQVGIVYENPEDKDTPVTIICKSFYVEFSLIHAIGKSLYFYPTISCVKIENCCISSQVVEALALVLAEDSGKWITELSLNGNEGLGNVLPVLVKSPTSIRYLSLQRCSLDDEGIKPLAEALSFDDVNEQKLQVLNLSMNKIGNAGMRHLAEALRTNRVLKSLSLAGNQIGDAGVERLTEVLQKFQLTFEEVVLRRKRIFDMIFKKKRAVEKYIEEWRTKGDLDGLGSKSTVKTGERAGRKIRGPDGKIRCLSSRDKKNKGLGTAKMNSGEKFRGKSRSALDNTGVGEPTPQEILALVQQVESEILPDKHPFVNEVFFTEDAAWCTGCWSLGSINLAFNYLTEDSLERFSEALYSQGEHFAATVGLLRFVALPGNLFQEDCTEFQKLQNALLHRIPGKEASENADPATAASVSTLKKLGSTGKFGKNR